MQRKSIEFGKVDYQGNGRHNYPVTVEVEIRETDKGPELSITGNIWNTRRTDCVSCGQNLDELVELVPGAKMRRIHEVWKEWHLNGVNAGTPAQDAALAPVKDSFSRIDWYTQACTYLESVGLLHDPSEDRDNGPDKPRGYRYGSEWLYRPLPADIIAEVETW